MEETMEELSRLQKWILFDVLPILNYLILQFEVLHNKTAVYDQHSPNFLPSSSGVIKVYHFLFRFKDGVQANFRQSRAR